MEFILDFHNKGANLFDFSQSNSSISISTDLFADWLTHAIFMS